MAYLSLTAVWETYLAVCVEGLDTSYSRDDRYIEWTIDGNSSGSDTLSAGASSSSSQYFVGLEPGTTYSITATIHYSSTPTSGVDSTITVSGSFTTEAEPEPEPEPDPRPAYFSWNTAKTSGEKFNLTASEWNSLMDNINDVRTWCGHSQYGYTSASSGATFTALIYNQAVNAINGISKYSGSLSSVSSGDKIYASQLNALSAAINSIS